MPIILTSAKDMVSVQFKDGVSRDVVLPSYANMMLEGLRHLKILNGVKFTDEINTIFGSNFGSVSSISLNRYKKKDIEAGSTFIRTFHHMASLGAPFMHSGDEMMEMFLGLRGRYQGKRGFNVSEAKGSAPTIAVSESIYTTTVPIDTEIIPQIRVTGDVSRLTLTFDVEIACSVTIDEKRLADGEMGKLQAALYNYNRK